MFNQKKGADLRLNLNKIEKFLKQKIIWQIIYGG